MKCKAYHPRKVMSCVEHAQGGLKQLLKSAAGEHKLCPLTPEEADAVYKAYELLAGVRSSLYRRLPKPIYSTDLYVAREAKKRARQGFRARAST